MMKLDGLFCRLMSVLMCAVMLAGLLPAGVPAAYAEETAVYGRVTADEVFFRYSASKSSDWKFKMALNTIVEITKDKDANGWYGIKATEPGQSYPSTGYCSANYIEVMTPADVEAWKQAGSPAVFAPSEDPAVPDDPDAPAIAGRVTIIEAYRSEGVNLRDGVDGDIKLVWKHAAYASLPYTEKLSSNWYKVIYEEQVYFVNGTVVAESDADGNYDGGSDADGGNDSEGESSVDDAGTYVTIRSGYKSVNLRQSAGGTYRGMWKASEHKVLPYYGTPVYVNGYNWYPVEYNGKTYYVTGQFVAECDKDGKLLPESSTTPDEPDSPEPENPSEPTISVGTIRLTADKVIFRKTPGGAMLRRLPLGTTMPFDGTKTANGFTWFNATAANGQKGWIREDVCDVIDGTYTEDGIIVGELVTVKGGVNLRKTAAGTSLQQLAKGITMPILDNIDGIDGGSFDWFKVKAPDGTIGYVRSDCVKITATGAGSGSGSGSGGTESQPSSGYVMITANKVKLRKSAAGSFLKYLNDKEVYPLVGSPTTKSGYDWYPIKVDATVGYVRDDFSDVLDADQTEAYLKGDPIPEPKPTPTGDLESNYLISNAEVNLRASASTDSEKKFVVDKGTVMGACAKQTVGGVDWYKAVYKNTYIWVMAKYVDVMTNAEYEQWLADNPDAEKPSTEVISGYVKTTSGGLNLRKEAGGTVITRLSKGLVLPYETAVYLGNDLWYKVKSPSNGWGYIIEDYLKITDEKGNVLPDAKPEISTPSGGSTSTGGKQEASYATLRKGATGEDVKKMVAELKAQGYWSGTVVSTYNSDVVEAVKKFQKAKGLDVDGIAGPNTLHTLFGTVPAGSASGMPPMAMYPVEKIDWWTGGIQKLWPKGKDVVVKDVKTGYTFWCHRWSGGNHVDAEPLTANDTATICRMYGVSSADQIESKNLWHRRPLWITIGNRTFAASMFGFPHNYPDGDTISNNNFKGQFCIHFTNSTIHRTDLKCEYHQAAIQEAYNKAPSRK